MSMVWIRNNINRILCFTDLLVDQIIRMMMMTMMMMMNFISSENVCKVTEATSD
jgi:hypothetical protein